MKYANDSKPRILLLSGYDASSHRHWRRTLERGLPCFDWTQVALPDRYFSWRIRGNSLSFAFQYKEILQQNFDCLIVTSMVDLASLRGFIPGLAEIPTIVYFHENQFDYPMLSVIDDDKNIVNAQLTSIYTLLCADYVLFNSEYNRKTFFKGANQLFKKLPDGIPKGVLQQVEKNAAILPVPISDSQSLGAASLSKKYNANSVIEIVWNHRWEYDKQPAVLFKALAMLKKSGYSFKLHVLGQSFRQIPDCFEPAKTLFKNEIKTWGFQERPKYLEVLFQSDLVISTALHDFQGLSMLEAINSGCFPIAPNRVAYPEYMNNKNLYQVGGSIDEAQSLYKKLVSVFDWLQSTNEQQKSQLSQKQSINKYLEEYLLVKYEQLINEIIKSI